RPPPAAPLVALWLGAPQEASLRARTGKEEARLPFRPPLERWAGKTRACHRYCRFRGLLQTRSVRWRQGSPVLDDQNPLVRPRDRLRDLRRRLAARVDLLQLQLVDEELIAHDRLHRAQRLVERGGDAQGRLRVVGP